MKQLKRIKNEEKQVEKKKINLIDVLEGRFTEDEAIELKMKALSPKLFGIFNPVPHELVSYRKVLIPYCWLTYEYSMQKGINKAKFMNRMGTIEIIYDSNENHGFHFDEADVHLLKTKKKNLADMVEAGYEMIDSKSTEEEMESNCYDLIKYRLLRKISRGGSEVTLVKKKFFYRPALELIVTAKGKEMERYAYLDVFSKQSEHISGLKIRLDM